MPCEIRARIQFVILVRFTRSRLLRLTCVASKKMQAMLAGVWHTGRQTPENPTTFIEWMICRRCQSIKKCKFVSIP